MSGEVWRHHLEMRMTGKTRLRASAIALALTLASTNLALAANAGDYAPENIEKTNRRLGWICVIPATCPIKPEVRQTIAKAIFNDRGAEYLLALTLLTGDGLPQDRDAGILWMVRAAEAGDASAARDIAGRLRNGANIQVDETKIAEALKPQVDAGDVEAMRAMGPMYIGGRGVKQDLAMGLGLLKRAAEKGSSDAETDLAQLYLNGAPGIQPSRPEAMKWLGVSAQHGNVGAMVSLGFMAISASINSRSIPDGYCWLMRAALLDDVRAHEKLSTVFAQGERDDRGNTIPVDLVQADLWFRLAARSPYHDNSQIRAMIEPKMTTDQQNEAKKLFDAWRPSTLAEVKTMTLKLPGGSAACPAMT
jgi:TPR repeat protein